MVSSGTVARVDWLKVIEAKGTAVGFVARSEKEKVVAGGLNVEEVTPLEAAEDAPVLVLAATVETTVEAAETTVEAAEATVAVPEGLVALGDVAWRASWWWWSGWATTRAERAARREERAKNIKVIERETQQQKKPFQREMDPAMGNLLLSINSTRTHLGMNQNNVYQNKCILRPFVFCSLAFQGQFPRHRRHRHLPHPQSRCCRC